MNKYVDRLFAEWKKHKKIIIGVDYDDTVFPWKFKDSALYSRVLKLLNQCQITGAYIVMFTASDPNRYEDILAYMLNNGIKVDSINENPIDLPYGKGSKIYANIFIDDRAGILEALDILEEALFLYREWQMTDGPLGTPPY